MDLLPRNMDLIAISMSVVALILGGAIGWLVARSRFRTTIADLNSKLVLERRVNKQLYEKVHVDAVSDLMQASNLTTSGGPARQQMALSG